jgi:hypothetical protein
MKMLHGASYLAMNNSDKCRSLLASTLFPLLSGTEFLAVVASTLFPLLSGTEFLAVAELR